ncbi:MAG TPA: sigma factor [Alphaproteobacteria bacterium]|nr:sigma factor [Alphaproteobacteria bacterium]
MPNSLSDDGGRGDFTTTDWNVVLEAGGDASASAAALERLCSIYWYPIYAFIRRRGFDRHSAEDLAQSFFACLLGKEMLKKVNPEKGKFRSFLLSALTNFMANEWDTRHAAKRGGHRQIVSLEELEAEEIYQRESVEPLTPEKLFERSWAFTLLERTLARLKTEYANKAELFRSLEPELTREPMPGLYRAKATELKMSEGAVKVALHRLRRRFGQLLRSEVAHTVSTPEEVDQEIRYLFTAISTPAG